MSIQRLKVLFLPAWYPSEDSPVTGIFVREHARAAHLYADVVVIHAYLDPSPDNRRLFRTNESVEGGIRTIRVKYGGALASVWKKLNAGKQTNENNNDFELKHSTLWSKLFLIPAAMVNDLLYNWSIITAFRKLVKEGWKPDIIHSHVFTAGVTGMIIGKRFRIPVVITEHWDIFLDRKLTLLDRSKARFAMNNAGMILPVSSALEAAIKAYGIKNIFEVVPNAVNTEVFYFKLSDNRRESSKKKLLFVGLLTPVKGVPFLLQAIKSLKNCRQDFILDIVGNGPGRLDYEELARTLGVWDLVKFAGLVSKSEVAEFMRACDFLVAPSLHETFGVTLIEVMACGKPVIATNVGGSQEIVNNEVGLLISPQDAESLTKAIDYMLDNFMSYSPERIERYSKEKYGYEAVGSKLDRIYKQLVFGDPGGVKVVDQDQRNAR